MLFHLSSGNWFPRKVFCFLLQCQYSQNTVQTLHCSDIVHVILNLSLSIKLLIFCLNWKYWNHSGVSPSYAQIYFNMIWLSFITCFFLRILYLSSQFEFFHYKEKMKSQKILDSITLIQLYFCMVTHQEWRSPTQCTSSWKQCHRYKGTNSRHIQLLGNVLHCWMKGSPFLPSLGCPSLNIQICPWNLQEFIWALASTAHIMVRLWQKQGSVWSRWAIPYPEKWSLRDCISLIVGNWNLHSKGVMGLASTAVSCGRLSRKQQNQAFVYDIISSLLWRRTWDWNKALNKYYCLWGRRSVKDCSRLRSTITIPCWYSLLKTDLF